MKIPDPLYPCVYCYENYSWPAHDLFWSDKADGFVCYNCWDQEELEDHYGPNLADVIKGKQNDT